MFLRCQVLGTDEKKFYGIDDFVAAVSFSVLEENAEATRWYAHLAKTIARALLSASGPDVGPELDQMDLLRQVARMVRRGIPHELAVESAQLSLQPRLRKVTREELHAAGLNRRLEPDWRRIADDEHRKHRSEIRQLEGELLEIREECRLAVIEGQALLAECVGVMGEAKVLTSGMDAGRLSELMNDRKVIAMAIADDARDEATRLVGSWREAKQYGVHNLPMDSQRSLSDEIVSTMVELALRWLDIKTQLEKKQHDR